MASLESHCGLPLGLVSDAMYPVDLRLLPAMYESLGVRLAQLVCSISTIPSSFLLFPPLFSFFHFLPPPSYLLLPLPSRLLPVFLIMIPFGALEDSDHIVQDVNNCSCW